MTKQEFKQLLTKNLIFLDGATGSNLQKRGMPTGVCPELWITEHPEVLKGLQQEYVAAGSNIVYAPTFSGNRIKMEEYGLADRLEEINTRLVKISREAVEGKAYVAGDITMTGAQLEPLGEMTFAQLLEVYEEQLEMIAKAGVDLLVVETMMSLQETRAAVLAARAVCPELPIMATLSFTESGNTLYGASAEAAAVVLESLGVDAVGLNCSAGPDKMVAVVERMRKVTPLPLIAKPNAGLPKIGADGQTVYDMNPEDFASHMKTLVDAGACIVGGCCGTTPEYIRMLSEHLNAESPRHPEDTVSEILLSGERRVYGFSQGQVLEMGEGIDFTADEELMEEYLEEETFFAAQDLAFDLQDDEADAILFCADGLDREAEILLAAVADVTQTVQMPVVIATADAQVAKDFLQGFSGVAGVKPITDNDEVRTAIADVVCAYGAKLISENNEIIG